MTLKVFFLKLRNDFLTSFGRQKKGEWERRETGWQGREIRAVATPAGPARPSGPWRYYPVSVCSRLLRYLETKKKAEEITVSSTINRITQILICSIIKKSRVLHRNLNYISN